MVTQANQEQEVAIFLRLFHADNAVLSPEAARSLLALEFSDEDQQRMRELANKARAGDLTEQEQAESQSYSFVGNLLGVLKSKACRSLDSGE